MGPTCGRDLSSPAPGTRDDTRPSLGTDLCPRPGKARRNTAHPAIDHDEEGVYHEGCLGRLRGRRVVGHCSCAAENIQAYKNDDVSRTALTR